MADIEQNFIVYVFTPSGDDAFDFEFKYGVTTLEKKLIDSVEERNASLIDDDELAILYTLLDKKAYELAVQRFWDKNPDASDDAFDDYQVVVEIG